MLKAGLSALVESSGLKPAELHQLRLLSERLFDELGEGLTAIAGKPVKIAFMKLEPQTSADFCADSRPHHFTVLGFGDDAAVVLRMDLLLACALVRAALGADVADLTDTTTSLALTPIETGLLARSIPEVFIAAVERVLGELFANRQGLHVIFSSEGGAAASEYCEGSEQLVAASVECAVVGINATLSFAMPLPTVVQVRERLVPARPEKRVAEPETRKIRRTLAPASMELNAVLGSVTMSLGEVRSLAPGSVVLLQKLGNEVPRVTLQCGQRTLFSGTVVEDAGWYRFLVQPILSGGKQDGDTGSA